MSEIRVDNITDEEGTGSPSFPNGIVVDNLGIFDSGSAGSPSITFDGDTNTGLFRPAADTLAASTNGSERMRIDSSGNVGIGTSSPRSILAIQSNSEPRISCQGRIAVIPDGDTGTIPIPFAGGCIVMIFHNQDGNAVNFTSTVFAVCGRAPQGYAITQLSTNNGVVGRSFTVEQNENNAELLITNTSGTQCRLDVSVIGM